MATPAQPTHQDKRDILFVDDDPLLRKLGALLLSHVGYNVRSAADGIEAIEAMEQSLPALVISDLRMPRMSGFELLSIVRRRFPHLPLIAISGEFLSHSEILGIADAFFAKGTYTADKLCEKVAELLANPPQRRDVDVPPMWVPVGPGGEIVLTCTDCLRSFPIRVCPPSMGTFVRKTECLVCGATLAYCVDHTTLQSSQKEWDCSALQNIRMDG